MLKNVVHIVGDKFELFSQNENIIKIKTIEERLNNQYYHPDADTIYFLSQGISQHRLDKLLDQVKKKGLEDFFCFNNRPLADKKLSHKHESENVMIGEPRRLSESEFEVDMIIDDDCAEMSDHLTGQHVQGMVLMESARQTFLAVTEKFYINSNYKYYFVINSFNTNYKSFIFPLGVKINYRVKSADLSDPKKLKFSATMDISQVGGSTACEVDVSFTAFESSVIERIEAKRAENAIRKARKMVSNIYQVSSVENDTKSLSYA